MISREQILEEMERPGFDEQASTDDFIDSWDRVLESHHGNWASANREWQAACELFDRRHAPEEFEEEEEEA